MITGAVSSDEPRVRLKVIGKQGQEHEVGAVVDSGYTGVLTLPPAVIRMLGLRQRSIGVAILADGSACSFQIYSGKVVWDGEERAILVDEADTDPLIGMKLLRNHEFKMQVRQGGKVTIKRLPRRKFNGT
jgi:clan AA aspartic protease